MNAQPENVQTMLARIEALERQNRLLKQIAVGGLLLLVTVAVMGVSSPSRTIEAQRFVLTDSTGRTRAVLGMEKDSISQSYYSPTLTLYTENGKPGLQLIQYGLDTPIPEVRMPDANGNDGAILSQVGLLLYDPNRKSHVDLTASPHPSLTMSDGLPIVSLGVGAGEGTEPRLVIWDNQGFASTLGVTTLTDVASGSKRLTSAASLVMENKAGTILWSAETVQQQIEALGGYVGSIRPGYKSPDDVQRELDEFKEAACPVLRTARRDDIARTRLDSACGLH